MLRTVFHVFLSLLVTSSAWAASISIESCLARARTDSPLLRLYRADTAIASAGVQLQDAALMPRLDAQLGFTTQLEAQAIKINGTAMETQQPSYLFGNLGISYTLYDFGRRDARRTVSKTNLAAVADSISQQEHELTLQVTDTYLNVLEAMKNLEAAEEERQTMEEHRRVAEAFYQSGSVTRNDLLQAELRLATARQQVLTWRNQIENLYLRLNYLIGAPHDERPQLQEPPSAPLQPVTNDKRARALRIRPDLNLLRKGLAVSEQELAEARSNFYPELFTRLTVDYLENSKVREQTIYAGTIGIKVNLFDGFGSTATRNRIVATRSKALEQIRLAEQQANLEISTAANNLQVAHQRIEVTALAIRQGQENLRINQNRYQERVGTATDVLDAQTLLTQARNEQCRARYDYQRAAIRLRKALGEL